MILIALWCLLACESRDAPGRAPPPEPVLGRSLASARAEPTGPELLPSAPAQSTPAPAEPPTDTRRHLLRGPPLPLQHLALTRHRLAQLSDARLTLYQLGKWDEPTRAELSGARRIAGLIGGSLLVLTNDAVLRWSPQDAEPQRFQRVSLLGPAFLVPDREAVTRFSVLHGFGKRLDTYDLNEQGMTQLQLLEQPQLVGYDGGALTFMKNAAAVYTATGTGSGTRVLVELRGSRATERRLPETLLDLRGIEPHRSLRKLWMMTPRGLALVELRRELHVVWQRELDLTPYAWDGAGDLLAVVGVKQRGSARKQWLMRIYDDQQRVRYEVELPEEGDPHLDDWVDRATANREIVLSATRPIAAVGGATALWVYDWRSGEQLLSSPAE